MTHHVEGYHVGERDFAILVALYHVSVDALWAAARRQTKHERSLGGWAVGIYATWAVSVAFQSSLRCKLDHR